MKDIIWANLNWTDYTIIALVVISTFISLIRGFVREALSLITWIIALWIAYKFAHGFSDYLINYIKMPSLRFAAAFVIIFIAILIAGALVNFAISSLVSRTGLSGTDRLIGLIFGVARGVLLIGIMVLLGNMANLNRDSWWTQSQLVPHFQDLAAWLKNLLPEQFDNIHKMVDELNNNSGIQNAVNNTANITNPQTQTGEVVPTATTAVPTPVDVNSAVSANPNATSNPTVNPTSNINSTQ